MSTNETRSHERSRTLRSARLSAEIAIPGAQYRGARYDWTGFITQVVLDGRHTFCGVESTQAGQGDGGVGLCNEFGITTAIDYDDAQPGEKFSKLGVGLLTRADASPYQFSHPYDVQPYTTHIEWGEDVVRIVSEPQPCRGSAARLTKTIRLQGSELSIEYSLANTGTRALRTEEYAHNYLFLDSAAITPDYSLATPASIHPLLTAPQFHHEEDGLRWISDAESHLRIDRPAKDAFYLRAAHPRHDPPALAPAGSFWEITNHANGLSIRETTDFPWWNFALYGAPHCICPEVFIRLDIVPGQMQSWSRRYRFSTLESV